MVTGWVPSAPGSDQYALACAALELLSGAVPFVREQDMAVIYAHPSAPPPSLADRFPDSGDRRVCFPSGFGFGDPRGDRGEACSGLEGTDPG